MNGDVVVWYDREVWQQYMKKHLFYTFLVIFAATALITLLGLIDLVPVREGFLAGLVTAFLIELAGAVIAMFRMAKFFTDDETFAPLTKDRAEANASLDGHDDRVNRLQADVDRIRIECRQLRLEFDQLKSLRRRIRAVLGASSKDAHGAVTDLGL